MRLSVGPNIEGIREILDSPKKKKVPYRGLGQFPTPKELAEVLDIPFEDLVPNIKVWGKVKDQDHVPSLLADVYHTLHLRFEKNGGLMLCCIPLLYKWFVSHVFKDIDVIEKMDGYEWSQKLVGLTEKAIIWYPQGLNLGNAITSCGNVLNVPLVGSKDCINYNIVLAVRQLGYPITYRPNDQLLEGFMFHDIEDPIMLKKIIRD
ncbi:hypothetical protein KIW84_035598 [Lathyrus oleraceus]|uniref:DUF7745 domain-containing protein n=1 Tax=Pisum sativum TaxID=3888 RepID=A0A9D5B6V9_PEA|nr:hypothetical protein KIW84_035598 [Pisum sativum]